MDLSRLDELNENKFFQGALFLLYVIAGKDVFEGPAKNLKHLIHIPLIKYFVVFAAAFVVTKNIRESGILTLGYIVVFGYLLNPGSGVSLISMPKKEQSVPDLRPVHTQLEPNQVPQPMSQLMKQPEPEDRLNQFFQPMSLEMETPF
jgi:hypothetical protein